MSLPVLKPNRYALTTLTKAQQVVETIKDMIVDAGLQPGDLLPTESELCGQLGVGRTALREAMKTLQAQRIVSVQQGRGTFVSALSLDAMVDQVTFHTLLEPARSPQRLRDMLDIRELLECGLAARMIEQDRLPDRAELKRALDQIRHESDAGAVRAQTDLSFHRTLYSNLDNPIADELILAFWGIYEGVWRILPPVPDAIRHHGHVEAHERIRDAVFARDAAATQAALVEHFIPLRQRIAALLPMTDGTAQPRRTSTIDVAPDDLPLLRIAPRPG